MSTNPYAPPNAAVSDPAADLVLTVRPNSITWSTRLLWFALFLSGLNVTLNSSRFVLTGPLLAGAVIGVLLSLGLIAWLTIKIYQGRNWARITLLIVILIGLPRFITQLPALYERSFVVAAIAVLISVLELVALGLTFVGPGSHWFRRRKESSASVA